MIPCTNGFESRPSPRTGPCEMAVRRSRGPVPSLFDQAGPGCGLMSRVSGFDSRRRDRAAPALVGERLHGKEERVGSTPTGGFVFFSMCAFAGVLVVSSRSSKPCLVGSTPAIRTGRAPARREPDQRG